MAQTAGTGVDPDEIPLWEKIRFHDCKKSRSIIIEKYMPFARKIAGALYANRGARELEFDDFMQLAFVGLVEAVDTFNHELEANFRTFSSYRIRGSVLNSVHTLTESSAQGAYRKRYMEDRVRSISAGKESGGSDKFMEMMDITVGLALGYLLEDSNIVKNEQSEVDNPYNRLVIKRLQEKLLSIIERLPEKELKIIKYHYLEHFSFREISEMLNLTKGRVSQLHKMALEKIRKGYSSNENYDQIF